MQSAQQTALRQMYNQQAALSTVLPEAVKAWLALLEALPDPQASNQL